MNCAARPSLTPAFSGTRFAKELFLLDAAHRTRTRDFYRDGAIEFLVAGFPNATKTADTKTFN